MNYQPLSTSFTDRPDGDHEALFLNQTIRQLVELRALETANSLASQAPYVALGGGGFAKDYVSESGRKCFNSICNGKSTYSDLSSLHSRHQAAAEAECDRAASRRSREETHKSIISAEKLCKTPLLTFITLSIVLLLLFGDLASAVWTAASYLADSGRLPEYAGKISLSVLLCGFPALGMAGVKMMHGLVVTERSRRRFALSVMVVGLGLMFVGLVPLFGANFNPYWVNLAAQIAEGNLDWALFDLGFWPSAALVIVHLLATGILGGGLAIAFERAASAPYQQVIVENGLYSAHDEQEQKMAKRAESEAARAARFADDLNRYKNAEEDFIVWFAGRVAYFLDCYAGCRATTTRELYNAILNG